MFACFAEIAESQVRGIPPSVTSLAPGRAFLPGSSVTSLGPHGWNHSPALLGNRHFFHQGAFGNLGYGNFGYGNLGYRNLGNFGYNGGVVPVFVPIYTPYGTDLYPMMYAEPDPASDPSANNASSLYMPDPNYAAAYGLRPPSQLRNQTGTSDIREESSAATVATPSSPPSSPPEPQPTTMLVFKDGHKLEITNYVIQGATLFNLGDKGPRKIALADLDVNQTVKVNDDRGVVFTLP